MTAGVRYPHLALPPCLVSLWHDYPRYGRISVRFSVVLQSVFSRQCLSQDDDNPWLSLLGDGPGQAHLKLAWVFLYGDRVICNQNPFVPRGGTLWVCSQRHRFRTILPR